MDWPHTRASWDRLTGAWRDLMAARRRAQALRLVMRAFAIDPQIMADLSAASPSPAPTGRTMTPTYAEAAATLTEALRASDDFGAPEVYCTRETARALLAGPPEPTEEEIARAIGYCFGALVSRNPMPHMSGDPRARLEPHIRRQFDSAASEAAQAVQALYRSTAK